MSLVITNTQNFLDQWKKDVELVIRRTNLENQLMNSIDPLHVDAHQTHLSLKESLEEFDKINMELNKSPLLTSSEFLNTFPRENFKCDIDSLNNLNHNNNTNLSEILDLEGPPTTNQQASRRLAQILAYYYNQTISIDVIDESSDMEFEEFDENTMHEFEDVIVPLSDTEFQKLKDFQWKLEKKVDEKCAICLEEYNIDDNLKEMICHHSYHTHCIKEWFEQSVYCPLCKCDQRNQPQNGISYDKSI